MAKLADKVSGGSRSLTDEEAFARLRSVLSTGRKQGRTAVAIPHGTFTPPSDVVATRG